MRSLYTNLICVNIFTICSFAEFENDVNLVKDINPKVLVNQEDIEKFILEENKSVKGMRMILGEENIDELWYTYKSLKGEYYLVPCVNDENVNIICLIIYVEGELIKNVWNSRAGLVWAKRFGLEAK